MSETTSHSYKNVKNRQEDNFPAFNFVSMSLFQDDKAGHREEPSLVQQTQVFPRGASGMNNIYIIYHFIMVALVLILLFYLLNIKSYLSVLFYLLNIKSYLSGVSIDGPLKILVVRRTGFIMLIVVLCTFLLINFQHNVGKI